MDSGFSTEMSPEVKKQRLSSLLLRACFEGNEKQAITLIDQGANVHTSDEYGNTALHFAANGGHQRIVEKLLSKGVEVNTPNKNGDTALHFAAGANHSDVVTKLLALDADVNAKNNKGFAPLHAAAWKGHKTIVEILIENYAETNGIDKDGATALHIAAWKGHTEVADLLITKGQALVSKPDHSFYTPLFLAMRHKHPEMEALLLRNDALDNPGWAGKVSKAPTSHTIPNF